MRALFVKQAFAGFHEATCAALGTVSLVMQGSLTASGAWQPCGVCQSAPQKQQITSEIN